MKCGSEDEEGLGKGERRGERKDEDEEGKGKNICRERRFPRWSQGRGKNKNKVEVCIERTRNRSDQDRIMEYEITTRRPPCMVEWMVGEQVENS